MAAQPMQNMQNTASLSAIATATAIPHRFIPDITSSQGSPGAMSSSPTPPAIPAAAPMPRANSFAIRRRPVSTTTNSARKPLATQQPASPLTPPPSATTVTAESGGGVSALAHSSNTMPTTFTSATYNVVTPPMSPETQQTERSINVAAVTSTPLPQNLNRASMHVPPPPPLTPVQTPSPTPSPSTSSQPSSEHPRQQQQQQQSVMYFPPPPGQNDAQNNPFPGGSSSPNSPTTAPAFSSPMIPPYNPAYATTQLPHSHLQSQQQQNGGSGNGNTATPSLGPTATPSFGLSMNGPTIPLVNNYSRRPESLRRMSKYVNKESAKKAYKSSLSFLAKTGECLDKYAQPAMPLLAATNPDIAAAYQLQQALKAGSLQQQQQQQQQQLTGGIPGSATAAAGASSSGSGGLAAVGGLAAAGLAGYTLFQGLGGGDGTDTLSMLASLTGQPSTADDPTALLLNGLQSGQTQPDLSALLQGVAGGQQQDLISAMLQQQQQQSSDAAASLLAGLGSGGGQGADQPNPSQQIMDYIQQQSAASTQNLLSAMQNNPLSTQGVQQDFASQMLSALSQQQQQQPQAQADLLAAIQQQQAATNQALLSAMQGNPTTTGQDYGQLFASILQQQQQQQQAFMSTFQQQQQQQQAQTQQTNPSASEAPQQTSVSSQQQATYEEQLLNAALQQQQQQYGTSGLGSTTPATQSGGAAPDQTYSMPSTNAQPAANSAGQSQSTYSSNFPYNSSSGQASASSPYQQAFVPQQTDATIPNQYSGPSSANSAHPSVAYQQPHHPPAQNYTQQGPYVPSPAAQLSSNTAATPPQQPPFQQQQQQSTTTGQVSSQGWPSQIQLELPLNVHNTQHSAPPPLPLQQQQQQQTQQSGFHQDGGVALPPTSLPPVHPQQHAANPPYANVPPLVEVTPQLQQQQQPAQCPPATHSQPMSPASPETLGVVNDNNAASTTGMVPQHDVQHGVPHQIPQTGQQPSIVNSSSSPEAMVIHPPPSQPIEFHGQLSPEINMSPSMNLELNIPQPQPLPTSDTAAAPLSSAPSPSPSPSPSPQPHPDQQPPPVSSPRPPPPPSEANTTTEPATWTEHHHLTFGLKSLMLPPETTLEQTRPHILVGDLDPQNGMPVEIRLLYDTAQVQHEIDVLRSTASTQDFVIMESYRSYCCPSSSSPALAPPNAGPSPNVPAKPTTAAEEKEEIDAETIQSKEDDDTGEIETATVHDDDANDDNSEIGTKNDAAINAADEGSQSQVHALTLAATTPDPDGDIMALHKFVVAAPNSSGHGLVFSLYAPLLPGLGLTTLKQTSETLLRSIVWTDRSTSCQVVSEELLGTWVLTTRLNPVSSSSPTAVGQVENVDIAREAPEVVITDTPVLSRGAVAVEDETSDIPKEPSISQCETKMLRFLEGRRYKYDRNIVSENIKTENSADKDDSSNEKGGGGKERRLDEERTPYDPDHTRGRFEAYEYSDGAMHLVLTEAGTGSVEVQIIQLTDKAMLVKGRIYMKTP